MSNKTTLIATTIFCIAFLAISVKIFAQDQDKDSPRIDICMLVLNIARYSDSLDKAGTIGVLDSVVFIKADSLDEDQPKGYVGVIESFMKNSKFNDACFLYNVARFRNKFYKSANPTYNSDKNHAPDSAVMAMDEFGSILDFLQANIDNYIAIIKQANVWCKNHDYKFYPKDKDLKKYDSLIIRADKSLIDMQQNKSKYREPWKEAQAEVKAQGMKGMKLCEESEEIMEGHDNNKPQDEMAQCKFYENITRCADSLAKTGKAGVLDSAVFIEADSLDKGHPAAFYEALTDFMDKSEFNEACFLYYLARLRYQYYNAANPAYKAGDDGALAASLAYEMSEPLNFFLRSNIDNYTGILQHVDNWWKGHDYTFFSKTRDIKKYDKVSAALDSMIMDMQTNRNKYLGLWKKDQEDLRNGMIKSCKELEEKKKKLQTN